MYRLFLFLLIAGATGATNLPLYFEPNQGQAHPKVEFLSRGNGSLSYLTARDAVFTVGGSPVTMHLAGANAAKPEGIGRLPGISSYFRGQDRTKWRTGIPQFAKVRYREVYPGIDLVYYGSQGNIEYDFQIAAGADPARIHIAYGGTGKLRIDQNGDLIVPTPTGEMRQRRPKVYQGNIEIAAAYKIEGRNKVGLKLGAYDRNSGMVIDPVLQYSTYFGGPGEDGATAVKLDAAGNVYIGGSLAVPQSDSNPFSSGTDPYGATEAAVIKFSPSQNAILYVAHVGSDSLNAARDLAVDSTGATYLTGITSSTDFPLVNPTVSSNLSSGSFFTFVSKIAADGKTLVYSTYLGGHAPDQATSIAVDAAGNAFVAGGALSNDFPTLNALYPSGNGVGGAFLTKFSPTGTMLFSTLYQGAGGVSKVVVDGSGSVYLVGSTAASNFPLKNSFLRYPVPGATVAYAVKLSSDGLTVAYSSLFGGSTADNATTAAVDAQGNLYVGGNTTSTDFPVLNAVQSQASYGGDAFIAELNPQGNGLVFSTYLGGAALDQVTSLAVNSTGNIYVAGGTASQDFPVVDPVFPWKTAPTANGTAFSPFVAAFSPGGQALLYSTFIGGSLTDQAAAIAADAAGNAYVVGEARSSDFPVTANAYQGTFGGLFDMWFAILAPDPASSAPSVTALPSILNFSMTIGAAAPSAQTVSIVSGANVSTSVNTSSGGNWLSVTPSGTTQLTVSVNPAGLAVGNYTGTIQVAAGGGTPVNLSVSFRIIPPVPVLKTLSPFELSLAISGAPQATATTFTISGSNFVSGSTVQVWMAPPGSGIPQPSLPATVVDANTIQFLFGANCYANSVTFAVTVTNPGTAQSNSLPLLCGPAEPRVSNVSSAAAPVVFNSSSSAPIAPGELITIGGADLGSILGESAPANSGTPVTQIGLTQVLFDGVPVPLMYVAENQINAAAPYSLNNKTTTSIVVVYNGVSSAPLTTQIVPSAAALFTADSSGKGQGAILNQDSTPNSPYNPAPAGSVVTVYATGMGATTPQGNSATPVLPVAATIGGQAAKVVSANAAPGVIGLLMATVQVPASAHSGSSIPITLQIGASQSQAGVTIAIQ